MIPRTTGCGTITDTQRQSYWQYRCSRSMRIIYPELTRQDPKLFERGGD